MANPVTFNQTGSSALVEITAPSNTPIDQLVLRITYPPAAALAAQPVIAPAPAGIVGAPGCVPPANVPPLAMPPAPVGAPGLVPPANVAPVLLPAAAPAPAVAQANPTSLSGRIARGIYNHSGKIGIIASAIIIASHTAEGGKVLADLGTGMAHLATQNYEIVKNALVDTAVFAKDHLPEINTCLSAMWAVPAAMHATSKKMKALWLVAGAASIAAPIVLQPGFSVQGAWGKVAAFGTSLLASAGLANKTEL